MELPTRVTTITGMLAIDTGALHTCGMDSSGQLHCWGANESGQLGDNTGTTQLQPASTGLSNVTRFSAGDQHTCATTAAGTTWCWGLNNHGQLGTLAPNQTCGGDECQLQPVPVDNF